MKQKRQGAGSAWFVVIQRPFSSLFIVVLLLLSTRQIVEAQIKTRIDGPILDDFEDGSYTDGSPTSWTPTDPRPDETHNIVNGDFIINRPPDWITGKWPFDDPDYDNTQYAELAETMVRDVSLRARARMLEREGREGRDEYAAVTLAVRICSDAFGGLGVCGDQRPGNWSYIDVRWNGEVHTAQYRATPTEKVVATDIRPLEEDVMLQVDAFGEDLKFWVWRPGEPRPAEPIIEYGPGEDVNMIAGGVMFGSYFSKNAYRYVRVSNEAIVDLSGDVNADWTLTVDDVDQLMTAIRTGESVPLMDFDTNGLVDLEDQNFWVKDLKKTWFGDANLDGEFNSGDLVNVFQAGKFETGLDASWSEGDWNADAFFDSSDFIAAFQDGGFEQGPRIAVKAVPEPKSVSLLALGLIAAVGHRRRNIDL